MRRLLYGIMALVAAVAASCSNETCEQNQSALPLAQFYSYQTLQPVNVKGLRVGAIGAPGDSLLLDTVPASQLYMPFNMQATATSWRLDYGRGINDTLTIAYDIVPYFASEACGAMYRYRIRRVSHTRRLLDSVGILDSTVTNYDAPCMRLYFTTDTAVTSSTL